MINARMDVLNDEVIQKCRSRNIEVRILKNSKANCMVFTTNNRTRREFEVTFLKGSHFRISSRFLGYKKVMMSDDADFFTDDDPDGRRKRFNIVLDEKDAVNRLLMRMLEYGFDDIPEVQLC